MTVREIIKSGVREDGFLYVPDLMFTRFMTERHLAGVSFKIAVQNGPSWATFDPSWTLAQSQPRHTVLTALPASLRRIPEWLQLPEGL